MSDLQASETTTIKPNPLTRRSLYTLALILAIAAYMRVSTRMYIFPTLPQPNWMIVSLVAIGLLWWVVYRYINSEAAAIAGLMYTASPWAVFFGGTSFLEVYILIVFIGFTLSLIAVIDGKQWAALSLLMIYLSGGAICLCIVMWFAHLPSESIILGTLNRLPTLTTQFTAGLGVEYFIQGRTSTALNNNVPRPSEIWLLFLNIAALIGFPALWFRSRSILLLTVFWIVFPVTIYIFVGGTFPDFLFLALPMICLLVGAGVAWLIKLLPGKPYSRMIVLAVYGAIFLSQGLWWLGVVRYLQSNP